MATLKEIQACQLNILKTVTEICDRHNIPYSLAFGTFLGAIRHQGFIPWDDDVDIYMKYEDFKKFKEVCKKELPSNLFYQDVETDPTTRWIFTKIRANGTFMPELSPDEAKKAKHHQGVWIDIFPLIKVADSHEKILKQIDAIHAYQHTVNTWTKIRKNKDISLPGKIVVFFTNLRLKHIANRSRKCFERLQSDASGQLLVLGNTYWPMDKEKVTSTALKEIFPAFFLQQRQKYSFEDTTFYGFKEYHSYLTQVYGSDYMTPKKWAHVEDYSRVVIDTKD